MNKSLTMYAAAGVLMAVSANAATLSAGQYDSYGSVTSNNGASTCAGAGLSQGSTVISALTYPGIGKTGFTLYTVPGPGIIQLCTKFPAIPAGGLNGFKASGTCTVYLTSGTVPPSSVSFSFTGKVTDAKSSVGTTTVTIPATSAVGAGCTATLNTTIVRTS